MEDNLRSSWEVAEEEEEGEIMKTRRNKSRTQDRDIIEDEDDAIMCSLWEMKGNVWIYSDWLQKAKGYRWRKGGVS